MGFFTFLSIQLVFEFITRCLVSYTSCLQMNLFQIRTRSMKYIIPLETRLHFKRYIQFDIDPTESGTTRFVGNKLFRLLVRKNNNLVINNGPTIGIKTSASIRPYGRLKTVFAHKFIEITKWLLLSRLLVILSYQLICQ